MPDTRPKASQWSLTLPSFTNHDIDNLSNLITHADVRYVTFTICEDDTGNRYLHGLIKTVRRCRIGILRNLVGPAIFSISDRPSDTLLDIQMNAFQEFGADARSCRIAQE